MSGAGVLSSRKKLRKTLWGAGGGGVGGGGSPLGDQMVVSVSY